MSEGVVVMAKPALVLFLSIVILFVATTTADSDPDPTPYSETASLPTISSSNLNFANSIYKILAREEGNVFFSPLSIQVILALTYMGARGSTAQQMAAGLHLPADENVVKEGFKAMLTSLKSDENITLDIANKLFAEQTFTMRHEFAKIARNSFLADVDSVDFKHKADEARLLINKWVENKTDDKIRDLLPPGYVNDVTSLVLVNAVYFKGDWAEKFNPEETNKLEFSVTATQTKPVDMMRSLGHYDFTHSEELDCKVLVVPYLGDKLSMVIFLPNAVDGITQLEAKLAEVDLPELMGQLNNVEVIVMIPKFKMDQQTTLKPVLQKLGMVNMFDEYSANFGGITDDNGLFVSGVVHKAFIEVNEEGSEAAAATGAVFDTRSYTERQVFKADRPFVFHIRDNNSGTLLFVGRLSSV